MNLFENLQLLSESDSNVSSVIDIITGIEYMRDALNELEKYYNANGNVPEDVKEKFATAYNNLDEIYEFCEFRKEATSSIGAGSYTTKAIDILPGAVKKISEGSNPGVKFYGKDYTDEEIQELIDFTKENPGAVGQIDPSAYADPINYNGKVYYTIGEGEPITYDEKDCVVFLTVDDELNKYLSYFELTYYDDGDGESGPQELKTDIGNAPIAVVEM